MEKTRDLFKKIRDTKGTFHAKTPRPLMLVRNCSPHVCRQDSESEAEDIGQRDGD